MRTPLSDAKHKWPIQGLKTIGSATSPSVVSVSSDGRLCQWYTNKLDQPINTPIDSKLRDNEPFCCVTCLGLPQEDTHTFALGTASGSIITKELKVQANKTEKNDAQQVMGEHLGPITSMH